MQVLNPRSSTAWSRRWSPLAPSQASTLSATASPTCGARSRTMWRPVRSHSGDGFKNEQASGPVFFGLEQALRKL